MPHTAACGPCVSGPAAAMIKSSARRRRARERVLQNKPAAASEGTQDGGIAHAAVAGQRSEAHPWARRSARCTPSRPGACGAAARAVRRSARRPVPKHRSARHAPKQDAVHGAAHAPRGDAVPQLVQQHAACGAAARAASGATASGVVAVAHARRSARRGAARRPRARTVQHRAGEDEHEDGGARAALLALQRAVACLALGFEESPQRRRART